MRAHDKGGGAQVFLQGGQLARVKLGGKELHHAARQPGVQLVRAPQLAALAPHGGGQRAHEHGFVRSRQAVLAVVALYPAGHRVVVQGAGHHRAGAGVLAQQGLQVLGHHGQQHRAAGEFAQVIGAAHHGHQVEGLCAAHAFCKVAFYLLFAPGQQGEAQVVLLLHMAALAGAEKGVLLLYVPKVVAAAADHDLGRALGGAFACGTEIGRKGHDHAQELVEHALQHLRRVVVQQFVNAVKHHEQRARARLRHKVRHVRHALNLDAVAFFEHQHQHLFERQFGQIAYPGQFGQVDEQGLWQGAGHSGGPQWVGDFAVEHAGELLAVRGFARA